MKPSKYKDPKILSFQAITMPYFRPDNGMPEAKVQIYGLGEDQRMYSWDFAEECWVPLKMI